MSPEATNLPFPFTVSESMSRFFDDSGSDAPIAISDAELDALEAEIPILAGIRHFGEEAVNMPWFSRLGRPLDAETRALARSWLDGLGFPDAEPARLRDWSEAADAAMTLDIDPAHWEAEESLRAGLTSKALELLSEDALTIAMTHVSALLGERVRSALVEAADFWEVDDEELLNAAAGAALHAAHGAALSLIADAPSDHPFRRKFALFARGRWPIGIAGLTLNLF